MDVEKEQFKKMFPRLAEELESEEQKVNITGVRSDRETAEKASTCMFTGYNPDVIDFIRRCDNKNQAEEIISYLEKRDEISDSYADRLRKQLQEKGIRSFGPKKEDDYYLKHGKSET